MSSMFAIPAKSLCRLRPLAILLILPLVGCFFSREIAETRRDIEAAYPDLQLEKQIVLNFGPFSLRTFGWFAGFAPDEESELAVRYLKDVKRVKVGIFKVNGSESPDVLDLGSLGFEKDWQVAVKTRREDERVWVMYREDAKTVEDLYVVVLSDDDLVIARVHGRLERLLAHIMEDHTGTDGWIGSGI